MYKLEENITLNVVDYNLPIIISILIGKVIRNLFEKGEGGSGEIIAPFMLHCHSEANSQCTQKPIK